MQTKPDHSVGFYWSCASSTITTNNRADNSEDSRYFTGFIVVLILLILSLIALTVVVILCRKLAKRQPKHNAANIEKYTTENNNSEEHYYKNNNKTTSKSSSSAGGGACETLIRYQAPVTHGLDDHRYASVDHHSTSPDTTAATGGVNKTKPAVHTQLHEEDEQTYEYICPEDSLLVKPANNKRPLPTTRKDNSNSTSAGRDNSNDIPTGRDNSNNKRKNTLTDAEGYLIPQP